MFVAKNSKVVSATQTGALIAHVGLVLHICISTVRKWCETHLLGLMEWDAFVVKNSKVVSATQTGALIAHLGPVLHNCMRSNEMVRNTPKHKFWV